MADILKYKEVIRNLSERVVNAQRPIRILDALKWDDEIEEEFFKSKFKKMPKVTAEYYTKNPLKYDPEAKIDEFNEIERDIRRDLGQFNPVGNILQRMCREYSTVIDLLKARGTPHFTRYSRQLYGSSEDAFYAGAPTLKDLAVLISNTIKSIQKESLLTSIDEKRYTSEEVVSMLGKALGDYFQDKNNEVRVKLSDNIIADAAAGAEFIKIRRNVMFSQRDIRVYEVHEGWVHLATTINGMKQSVCTFLSKGPPSSTVTQEGLAIIMEIFTFSSHPARILTLTDRITAVHMAEQGANFLEVFNFFRDTGLSDEASYKRSARVFRGSLPEGGPFTKDLVYNKGFILIYNYIRLSIQQGLLERIPLLFLGKTTLEDLHVFSDLVEEGIIDMPEYIPPQFKDLAGLSSWMCYSLFLNQLDLKRLAIEYKGIL
jgi:uncharacterized protein (TIGR02421 family)